MMYRWRAKNITRSVSYSRPLEAAVAKSGVVAVEDLRARLPNVLLSASDTVLGVLIEPSSCSSVRGRA